MHKRLLITAKVLCVLAIWGTAARGFGKDPMDPMDQSIRTAVAEFKGVVSLYAKNIDTGETYGIRENDRVRAASTIKVAIMVTVYDEVYKGHAKWTDMLTDPATGVRSPIRDLMIQMIVVSDNNAANLLLDRFPTDKVNQTMERLGLVHTRSLRKILGDDADVRPVAGVSQAGRLKVNEGFGIGVSTPFEMVTLLERLERGQVVTPAASKEMISIMKRQQLKDGIGRRTGNLMVASKSGSLDHLRSDVGIVFTPGGRVAIAATCEDIPVVDYSPENPGDVMISRLTGILLNGLQRNSVRRQQQAAFSSSDK